MKFVSLIKFTEQGMREIQKTTNRAASFKKRAKENGVKITEMLWLTGPYDGLVVFESADAETASALMLQLSRLGNITTETMLAFDSSGMQQVLDKLD